MKRKKKPKKKSPPVAVLTPEEDAVVRFIIEGFRDIDATEIVSRVTNSRVALILAERLPLDDESSVPLLLALKDGFEDKQVRRAVKRALFKLRKRGVPVEGFFKEDGGTPAVLKPPEKDRPVAYAGPLDMGGFRAVLVAFQRSVKGVDLGLGVISEEHGIQHFISGTFGKKRVKELRENMAQEAGPLVEISLAHAATILEASYQRHVELNSDSPAEYLELRPWLLDNATLLERRAIHDHIAEGPVSELILTDSQLEKLFEHNLMNAWYVEPDSIRPFMEEIQKIDDSPIVLTETQKLERVSEIKERCMEGLFSGSSRTLLKNRFEEMAYLFYKLGQEDTCLLTLAAARNVEQENTVLRKNPVIKFLLERSLDFYTNAMKESWDDQKQKEESSSRIILP